MLIEQISFIGQTDFDYYLGIVPQSPEQLEEEHDLKFLDDCDDLGPLKAAIVEVPTYSGVRKIIFERHEGEPGQGTNMRVQKLTKREREELLEAVCRILMITPSKLLWKAPYMPT